MTNALVPIDHLLAATLAVLFPIRAVFFGYRRLTVADLLDVPRVRMSLYRQGLAIQWGLAALALALWLWQRRPLASLGLEPRLTWGLLGVATGFAVVGIYVLVHRRKALADDEALARLRDQMQNLERMLPHTRDELSWFARLAVTAGICEELLYRGYLIWYLGHWTAVVPAALVASVVFGFGHAYQGPRGVAVTALVGLFMSAVYLITGSLVAGMVIHALMDLHAGHLAQVAFARAATVPEPPGDVPAG
jgi:CAAX protease family protein